MLRACHRLVPPRPPRVALAQLLCLGRFLRSLRSRSGLFTTCNRLSLRPSALTMGVEVKLGQLLAVKLSVGRSLVTAPTRLRMT